MGQIDLNIDENNELAFKVQIHGAEYEPSMIRFVCEGEDTNYGFKGLLNEQGEVLVQIPAMIGKLKEGSYNGKLEVVVEGRYFVPLEVITNFKRPLKVVAENVQVKKAISDKKEPKISVSMPAVKVVSKPTIIEKKKSIKDYSEKELRKMVSEDTLNNIIKKIK